MLKGAAMRKRMYGLPRWKWKSRGPLLMAACLAIVVLVKLQALVFYDSFTPLSEHKLYNKPKIAFLFLARDSMPLDFLWEHFFLGSRENEYTVYIHARPGFVYTEETTKCRSFINRQLLNSVLVEWGEVSMIQAERLLLSQALQDPLNQRLVLLSDSCIPLYNFRFIYDYLLSSRRSFLDSFVDWEDTQYNPEMALVIPHEKWRKGSQWFVLMRNHAEAIVEDSTVFPVFQQYCKKKVVRPESESQQAPNVNNKTEDEHNCIPDEHYIQTLLAMEDMEAEIERRTVTYSQWKNFEKGEDREGWHPVTFNVNNATLKTIKDIQGIYSINYETELRIEWCSANGEACPCYLFARKFTRGAGYRLLDQVAAYEDRILRH